MPTRWLLPAMGIVQVLPGQAVNDLNSLVLQAERFARLEMAAQGHPGELNLYLIRGSSLAQPADPMTTAVDVQRWILSYAILHSDDPPGHLPRSLVVTCEEGVFQRISYYSYPVLDRLPLDRVWITIPLEDAIHALRGAGVAGGFDNVTVERILHPRFPACATYVFHCPIDHVTVGISAQTGGLLWKEYF